MTKERAVLTVLLAVALVASVSGCGGDDEDAPVSLIGTWDADSVTVTDPELPNGSVTISSAFGMVSGTMVFNANGTFACNLNVPMIGETYAFSGTWSASSDELKMTTAGQGGAGTYTLSGSTLIVTYVQAPTSILIESSKRS